MCRRSALSRRCLTAFGAGDCAYNSSELLANCCRDLFPNPNLTPKDFCSCRNPAASCDTSNLCDQEWEYEPFRVPQCECHCSELSAVGLAVVVLSVLCELAVWNVLHRGAAGSLTRVCVALSGRLHPSLVLPALPVLPLGESQQRNPTLPQHHHSTTTANTPMFLHASNLRLTLRGAVQTPASPQGHGPATTRGRQPFE